MPWCPTCKNEYREGIKECADCKEPLVDQLEEDLVPVVFGEEEEVFRIKDFLQYNKIESVQIKPSDMDGIYEIFVSVSEEKKSKKLILIFKTEQSKEKMTEENENVEADIPRAEHSLREPAPFTTQKEKAENYKTSAYTLIGVSVLGILFLILTAAGFLNLKPGIMTYFLMGGLFLLFLIAGISSYNSYKKSEKEAVLENHLSSEIKQWCEEKLNATVIDEGLFEGSIPEEERYFKRIEQMKYLIKETYLNLEEGFLEALVEEIYPTIFE